MPVQQDLPSVGKLLGKILKFLLVLGVLGAFVWFYIRSLEDHAKETENVNRGLTSLAAELWETGMSLEVPDMDADLMRIFSQLKAKLNHNSPEVLVSEDNTASGLTGSGAYKIFYMLGKRMVLTLTVSHDPEGNKVDIRSYELGPDFQDLLKGAPPRNTLPPLEDEASKKGARPALEGL